MENHSTSSFCLLFLLALSLVTVTQSIPFTAKDLESEDSLWSLYERWRSHHTISRDLGEKQKRFNVFKENVRFIHEFNQQDHPYKLALNKFADLTNREFRTKYAGSRIDHHRALRGNPHGTSEFMYEKTKAPPSIDWRKKGAVTAVKNQRPMWWVSNSSCISWRADGAQGPAERAMACATAGTCAAPCRLELGGRRGFSAVEEECFHLYFLDWFSYEMQ